MCKLRPETNVHKINHIFSSHKMNAYSEINERNNKKKIRSQQRVCHSFTTWI